MNTELGAERPIVLTRMGEHWAAHRSEHRDVLLSVTAVGLGPTPAWAMHALKKAEKPATKRGVW